MKKIFCLLCCCLVLGQPAMLCQDRSGDVRLRVRDERGNLPKDETVIYANSYALLIGNSKYRDRAWNDLPDVAEDIEAVKAVLENPHGFKVEVALNQSRDVLLRTIDQFISRYGQNYNNRLLIYYSGHGYTALLPDERKMGYLVLPDAPAMPGEDKALRIPPTDEEFERFLPAAITMDEIETYARRIIAKHVLFVFDSCFSGTVLYKDMGTNVPTLITTEELKPVRAYLTAGNETQRVPAFSKFRRKFVAGLMGEADTNGDGYILSSELGRWVSIEVEKDTGRAQTPVFGKSDIFRRGDMVFVSPKGVLSSSVFSGERLYYQEMEKRNSIEAYEAYLSNYPNGEFTQIARLRLANLKWMAFKETARRFMKYGWAHGSPDGRILVYENGAIKTLDRNGNEVNPNTSNGITLKKAGEHVCSVTDSSGNELASVNNCDSFEDFSEGVAFVAAVSNRRISTDGGITYYRPYDYRLIDTSGRRISRDLYEGVQSFSEGLAFVKSKGKWGFIDKTGKVIVPFKYEGGNTADSHYSFHEGLARVKVSGKYGFIDKTGREVISPIYVDAFPFSDGLALVQLDQWIFIDRTGKEVIRPKYDWVCALQDGVSKVSLSGKEGLMDKAGKEIVPPKYNEIWCTAFIKEGFIGVELNGKKGFIDIYGNEYFDF